MIVVGCSLLTFPFSMNTYFGNVLPYIASYYQAKRNEIIWYLDTLWVVSAFNFIGPLSMVTCTLVEKWLGLRRTIFFGGALATLSILASFEAVREPAALVFTYGFLNALGTGLIYSLCTKIVLQVASARKGLAFGVMLAFQSVGSLVNIGVAFAVVNPSNTAPDMTIGNTNYFSDAGLISRVPYFFIATGLLTVMTSASGFALVQIAAKDLSIWNKGLSENTEASSVEPIDNEGTEKQIKEKSMCPVSCTQPSEDNSRDTDRNALIQKEETLYSRKTAYSSTESCRSSSKDEYIKPVIESYHHVKSSAAESPTQKSATKTDLTPTEALRTMRFWIIWVGSLFLAHTFYILTNLYKQYGLLRIKDDEILVVTGILSTVTLIATRPLAGVFSDKFGVKMTMVQTCAVSSIFMGLMVITIHLCPPLYIVATIVEFSCSSTYFMISSLLVNELIGSTHYPSIIGLVYTARVITSVLDPMIVDVMVRTVGWDWVFVSGVVSGLLSVLVSLALPEDALEK